MRGGSYGSVERWSVGALGLPGEGLNKPHLPRKNARERKRLWGRSGPPIARMDANERLRFSREKAQKVAKTEESLSVMAGIYRRKRRQRRTLDSGGL